MSDQSGQPPVPQEPVPPQPAQQPYPQQDPGPAQQPYVQQPYVQQPTQPQPAQPQGYAPQPGAVAPCDPQPAKKKSRVWIWIVLVVVLLLCCAGAVIAGVIGYGMNSAVDETATIKKADDAYAKAVEGLQAAVEVAATVDDPDAAAKATTALDTATADLATARGAIVILSDSEGKTIYLRALDEADKAVETLRSIAKESSGKSQFLATAQEGIRLYDEGHRHMNTAVGLANKNLYSRGGVEAGKAKSFFKQAREKLVEADAMDPASDLEKSVAYVDLQLEKVDYLIQMANYGNKKNISAYNKVVPKFNAINTKIGRLKEPDALSDENWATAQLDELQAQFSEELTNSGTLVDRARKLLAEAGS